MIPGPDKLARSSRTFSNGTGKAGFPASATSHSSSAPTTPGGPVLKQIVPIRLSASSSEIGRSPTPAGVLIVSVGSSITAFQGECRAAPARTVPTAGGLDSFLVPNQQSITDASDSQCLRGQTMTGSAGR